MNTICKATIVLAALTITSGFATTASAQVTAEELAAISVPDELETSIGKLQFQAGAPTPETAQTVYDYLDQMRGVQAFMDSQGAASMFAMRQGFQELGVKNYNQNAYYEKPMTAKSVWLVANSQTIQFTNYLDLKKNGPTVMEVAPGTLGLLDDTWQMYVADYDPVGPDKGKGGKYLILPPGYKGEIPKGYFVVKSSTYGVWNIGRGFLKDGDPKPALKIQEEPIDSLGPERRGVLQAIGIEKGRPFKPDARMKKILTDAANIGHASFRSLWWHPRKDTNALYKGTNSPFPGSSLDAEGNQNAR